MSAARRLVWGATSALLILGVAVPGVLLVQGTRDGAARLAGDETKLGARVLREPGGSDAL